MPAPGLLQGFFALVALAGLSAAVLPNTANIVYHLEPSTLTPTSALSSWPPLVGSNAAQQASAGSRPEAVAGVRHCHAAVRFTGDHLQTTSFAGLNPEAETFGFVVVTREAPDNLEADAMQKGTSWYALYKLEHQGGGGGITTVGATGGTCGFRTLGQANKEHFQVWGGSLPAGTGSRLVSAYHNGDSSAWESRWGACGASASGSLSSSDPLYLGNPTGNPYHGDILEVVVWKGGAQLSAADMATVQAHMEEKYFFYCPSIAEDPAVSTLGTCVDAQIKDGTTCTQSCAPPFVRTAGFAQHECQSGGWSNPPIVCQRTCPTLQQPLNAEGCAKVLLQHGFEGAAEEAALYQVSPKVPEVVKPLLWSVAGGVVATDTTSECSVSVSAPSFYHLAAPSFLDAIQAGQWMVYTADVVATQGVVGVVFRFLDSDNYMAVELDRGAGTTTLARTAGGFRTPLAVDEWPGGAAYNTGVAFAVSVTLVAQAFTVSVDGVEVLATSDAAIESGSFGFMSAAAVGTFDNARLDTLCDGTTCSAATPGVECSYGCAFGYTRSAGANARTCQADGAWSDDQLVCSLNPPSFADQTRVVAENATTDFVIGEPLLAGHEGVDVAVTFAITSGNDDELFKLGLCSGQLRLQLAQLDFEARPQYVLGVVARANNLPDSATPANVTIVVVDVPEAPSIVDGLAFREVGEHAVPGVATFGAPIAVEDPEGEALVFEVLPGTLGGDVFTVGPATGVFGVAAALDFEALAQYEVDVRVVDPSGLSDTHRFTVRVTDENDAPVFGDILLEVEAAEFAVNASIGSGLLAVDPDGDNVTFVSPGVAAFPELAIDGASGAVSFVSENTRGVYVVEVWAVDDEGASTAANLTVAILAADAPVVSGLLYGALSTAGGDTITISGSNFAPGPVAAAYASGTQAYTAAGCVYVSTAVLTCVTVPGVGSQLFWDVSSNGSPLLLASAAVTLVTSYDAPVLAGVDVAPALLATVGGESITVSGSNLGPSCDTLSATLGGRPLNLTSCTHDSFTAVTPPGGGAGLDLHATVGGVASNVLPGALSYAPPRVDFLSGASTLPTTGLTPAGSPAVVRLHGANFGAPDTGLVVEYGSGSDGNTYTLEACSRSVGHDVVTCGAVAGVGAGHVWRAIVEQQASSASPNTTSYPAPTLDTVTGPGSLNADTKGQQVVVLTGSNFGPPSLSPASIDFVTYGPTAGELLAAACEVIDAGPPAVATCQTVPGVGKDLAWVISVGRQVSNVAGATAYGRPTISFFEGDGFEGAATAGGQVVAINGHNFGPMGAAVTATYTMAERVSSVTAPGDGVPASEAGDEELVLTPDGDSVTLIAVDCEVAQAHVVVHCYTAPGGGTQLGWRVTVGNQTSQSPATAYALPAITRMSLVPDDAPFLPQGDAGGGGGGELSRRRLANATAGNATAGLQGVHTDGGQWVLVNGTNLGPSYPRSLVSAVTFSGPSGTYAVPNCTFLTPHAALLCPTPPGSGAGFRWSLSVAGQASPPSDQTLSYAPPVLQGVEPAVIPTQGAVVVLTGIDLGFEPDKMELFVNGAAVPVFTVVTAHTALRFFLDEVPGRSSVSFQVVVGGQASNVLVAPVSPPTVTVLDVYDVEGLEPADAAVDPCALAVAASGGDVVQVEGSDYGGAAAFVNVSLVPRPTSPGVPPTVPTTTCDVCHITHSMLRCVTTADRRVFYDLTVAVVGQASNTEIYNYQTIIRPPEVETIAPLTGPTEGGTLVDIRGTSFKDRGVVEMRPPSGPVLTCETPPAGDPGNILDVYYAPEGTHIRCRVPPGVGTGFVFEITARRVFGRVANLPFAFQPPSVTGVAPAKLPTTGGLIRITGLNFGAPLGGVNVTEYGAWNRSVRVAGRPCAIVGWDHREIDCVAAPGVARVASVVVSVGGQVNADVRGEGVVPGGFLGYNPPSLGGPLAPSRSPTAGGQVVSFTGEDFGEPSTPLSIHLVRPDTGAAYLCAVQAHDHTSGTCTTSVGAGVGLRVMVDTGNQTNTAANAEAFPFAYDPPQLDGFEAAAGDGLFPVAGGFGLRLTGSSFSTDPSVSVSGLPCDVTASSHHTIVCTAPSNFGVGHEVVVTAAGQASGPLSLDYDPPVVTGVEPATADAHFGSALDISGYNFGLLAPVGEVQPLRIEVSGEPCEPVFFLRETRVRCDATTARQLVGVHNLTVTTWRAAGPSAGNATNPDAEQASAPFPVRLVCPVDMFGTDGEFCSTCLPEATCVGGDADPIATAGHYRVDRLTFLSCKPAEACVGGGFDANGTLLPAGLQCAAGYEGVPCDTCVQGYYRLDEFCEKCPSMAWIFILFFVLVICLCLVFGVWLNTRRINLAALGIGVDFAQVVAMFVSLEFQWPSQLHDLFNVVSAFNLNIQIVAPECSLEWSYYDKWFIIAAMPIIAVGCTILVAVGIKVKNFGLEAWERSKGRSLSPPTEIDALYGLMFASFYYLYLQVVKNGLEPWDCTVGPDGRDVLDADPAIVCDSEVDPTYKTLRFWSGWSLAIYGIGIPLLFLVTLAWNRKGIMVDQELRGQGLGYTTASNPYLSLRRKYAKLYSDYKPHRWYWRLVLIARKFLLAATTVMFNTFPLFQAAVSVAVMFGAYVLHSWTHPYLHRENIPQVFYDLANSELSSDFGGHDRRLAGVAERAQSSVVRKVFNYNKLEGVSIVVATSILLAGMVFSSSALDKGSFGEWLLIVFVGAVIVAVMLYMFGMIVFETYRALNYSHLYKEVSDYAERRMVKKVTASDEAGNTAMSLGYGEDFNAAARLQQHAPAANRRGSIFAGGSRAKKEAFAPTTTGEEAKGGDRRDRIGRMGRAAGVVSAGKKLARATGRSLRNLLGGGGSQRGNATPVWGQGAPMTATAAAAGAGSMNPLVAARVARVEGAKAPTPPKSEAARKTKPPMRAMPTVPSPQSKASPPRMQAAPPAGPPPPGGAAADGPNLNPMFAHKNRVHVVQKRTFDSRPKERRTTVVVNDSRTRRQAAYVPPPEPAEPLRESVQRRVGAQAARPQLSTTKSGRISVSNPLAR